MTALRKPRRRVGLVDQLADRAPKSGRGLWGAEFTDTYGATVRVSDSSAADEPRMWIWTEGGGTDDPSRGKKNSGSIHLSQRQAVELAAVLTKFARDGHLRPVRAKRRPK